jgi:hypothetical protein
MNTALLLEIRKEYSEHLIDILVPFIYEGLKQIYQDAKKMAEENKKDDVVLIIFQKFLLGVPKWNQDIVIGETARIKEKSGTSEYFDDLVRVVIKSSINLLTYDPLNTNASIIGQTFYDNLNVSTLIHRCYIECAKEAYNRSFLFYHGVDPLEYKKNQNSILDFIKISIIKAIRKILPIKNILQEYIKININSNDKNDIHNLTKYRAEKIQVPKLDDIIDNLDRAQNDQQLSAHISKFNTEMRDDKNDKNDRDNRDNRDNRDYKEKDLQLKTNIYKPSKHDSEDIKQILKLDREIDNNRDKINSEREKMALTLGYPSSAKQYIKKREYKLDSVDRKLININLNLNDKHEKSSEAQMHSCNDSNYIEVFGDDNK